MKRILIYVFILSQFLFFQFTVYAEEENKLPVAPAQQIQINVDPIYLLQKKITGHVNVNSKMNLVMNDKIISSALPNEKGDFVIEIPKSTITPIGTKFEVTSLNEATQKEVRVSCQVVSKDKPKLKKLKVPFVKQMPELPRGCEVTSLTMMLKYAGIDASKMTLAKQIKKDVTPKTYKKGSIFFGNPNTGFVGSMYNFSKAGYGVYSTPILTLGNRYLKNRMLNLTGKNFSEIEDYIAVGRPIWVVTSCTFNYLPKKYWETWYTPTGKIQISYKEHSVLITGYSEDYIYINDPLSHSPNRKISKKNFIRAWKQFGKQAVTYI